MLSGLDGSPSFSFLLVIGAGAGLFGTGEKMPWIGRELRFLGVEQVQLSSP